MPYADWAAVTSALTAALQRLTDGEFLILGERSPLMRPRRGLFGRQPTPPSTRYVQALRIDDVLSAECVGATSQGGTWEMTDQTVEQLRGMCWLTPAQSKAEYGNLTPNFGLYVDVTDAPSLAGLMVASLAVLGAQPHALMLQSSEGLDAVIG